MRTDRAVTRRECAEVTRRSAASDGMEAMVSMKARVARWVAIGTALAGGIVLTVILVRQPAQGSVLIQFVPSQAGAPARIERLAIPSPRSSRFAVRVVHDPTTEVESVRLSAIVETPAGTQVVVSDPAECQRQQETCDADVLFAPFLSPTVNEEHPDGVVFTLGLESVRFGDGHEWRAERTDRRFSTPPGAETRTDTTLMMRLPKWARSRAKRLVNGPSIYPTNASLDGSGCTMSSCGRGYCEFDGCAIR